MTSQKPPVQKPLDVAPVLAHVGKLADIHVETLGIKEPVESVCARFAPFPGTVALVSGQNLDWAGHHMLAVDPFLWIKSKNRRIWGRAKNPEGRVLDFQGTGSPLDVLEEFTDGLSLEHNPAWSPVGAGFFGYLAYDLKDHLENLPKTSLDDKNLPDLCLYCPSALLVWDKIKGQTRLFVPKRGGRSHEKDRDRFMQRLLGPEPVPGLFSGAGFSSNFPKSDYLEALERIKEYIRAGDVYQVNMSQRFETRFSGDPFSLFAALFKMNPAPFYAFIQADDHQIISTSPERFLKKDQNHVETRPIKGTCPRGKTRQQDDQNREMLLASRKDDAELSMIVDLLRNDLGRACLPGSVKVTAHKRLEAYENVYHLVSVVEGELRKDQGPVELLRAAFPGGSITGCPKIRSMEIIDEMEPCRRHVYTGSIGYLGFHGTMDLSIAIRTATAAKGRLWFSVGGGIVFDSKAQDEFDETLHKGQTLMKVFKGKHKALPPENRVRAWVNGRIMPLDKAGIPVDSPGARYGKGMFETIRVQKGEPRRLKDHLARFSAAWRHLMGGRPPDLTWSEVIRQVVEANQLEDQTAALRICAFGGDPANTGPAHTLCVWAAPYTHRLTALGKQGLDLAVYPHARQSPLADHKTNNYLFYAMAGNWAKIRGADEAVICNPDGSISETNTGNLLIIEGKKIVDPASPHRLSGVMRKTVLPLVQKWGYTILDEPRTPQHLTEASGLLVTNALMGVAPVLTLDGKPLGSALELSRRLNEQVI